MESLYATPDLSNLREFQRALGTVESNLSVEEIGVRGIILRNNAYRMGLIAHYLTGEPVESASWESVRGKTFLDIGCGNDAILSDGTRYLPYLPTMLHQHGAGQVWGMDRGNQPIDSVFAKAYEHIKQDIIPLVDNNEWKTLPIYGMEFDVVNVSSLVGEGADPGFLAKLAVIRGFTDSIVPYRPEFATVRQAFEDMFQQQLGQFVREGGFLLFGKKFYQKVNGQLEELHVENQK